MQAENSDKFNEQDNNFCKLKFGFLDVNKQKVTYFLIKFLFKYLLREESLKLLQNIRLKKNTICSCVLAQIVPGERAIRQPVVAA